MEADGEEAMMDSVNDDQNETAVWHEQDRSPYDLIDHEEDTFDKVKERIKEYGISMSGKRMIKVLMIYLMTHSVQVLMILMMRWSVKMNSVKIAQIMIHAQNVSQRQ